MDRVYASNAAASLPATPSFVIGFPQGDAARPDVVPTGVGAAWFNWFTESIITVIEGAGLTPDGRNLSQFLEAVEILVSRG